MLPTTKPDKKIPTHGPGTTAWYRGKEAKILAIENGKAKIFCDGRVLLVNYTSLDDASFKTLHEAYELPSSIALNEALQDCPSLFDIYKMDKSVFDRLFKATLKKGFTFKQLKERDIIELTPTEAFKYGGSEGDKYIKLWITVDDIVGMVTWANTMIDDNFNWNVKSRKASEKRDNNKLIGIERFTKAYLKSNDAINMFAKVYMIPFDKLGNYKAFKEKTIKSIQTDASQNSSDIAIPAIIQKVKDLLHLGLDYIKYSEPGWIWAFQNSPKDEPILWQFEKYLPYYSYKWGVKTKMIGRITNSRGSVIVEKKGALVANGGKTEFIDNYKIRASIQLVARSIDDLNAGKLFTISEIKKLLSGTKIDELDLDLDADTLIDISKIDKKMLDNTSYKNVFVSQFIDLGFEMEDRSELTAYRYPDGCIVLKVIPDQKQLSFIEIHHSKERKGIPTVNGQLIGPHFERGKQLDKNTLPAWYISNPYDAKSLSTYGKAKLFVIAKNYNDFVKYKWYSFADNLKMIESLNQYFNSKHAAEKQAAEAKANDIKASNAEVLATQKPYLDTAKQYQAKIDAFMTRCYDEIYKMKPTHWSQIMDFWKVKLRDLTKLIWRGNPSIVNGSIANFTGFFYAGERKNNVVDLKNLYGAPGMGSRYAYIDERFKIDEFNKWVEKGWPKESNSWFLEPSTVIICNGGRIGICSYNISRIACENWHFSTNDGKNANGTIALKVDKIALAVPNAKNLQLYTFK